MMKVTVKPSTIHGQGAFATAPIACGEVSLSMDDSRMVNDTHPLQPGEDAKHCDWLPDGTQVLMREPECYINHCCEPNVFVYSANRRRFLLAMRDITAHEELTYDYSVNAVDGDVWHCRCGVPVCRGRHKCDFFALSRKRQLEYLPFLDPWFARVHQARLLILLETALG